MEALRHELKSPCATFITRRVACQAFPPTLFFRKYHTAPKKQQRLLVLRNVRHLSSGSKATCKISFFADLRTVNVPGMGDSITEELGDFCGQDELVAIIDTDKVSVDINSPESGVMRQHHANPGDTVMVGQPLFSIEPGANADSKEPQSNESSSTPDSVNSTSSSATSPAAMKTPDISYASAPAPPTSPPPSPPSESVAKVAPQEATSAKTVPQKDATPKAALLKAATPKKSESIKILRSNTRTEEIVPMSRLRKRVAERLKSAQNTAASLTTFNECDMGSLIAMRSELLKAFVEEHGIKFGFVSAFLHAASRSLMKMPQVNGYIAENGTDIVYKNYVDISVAVATKTGLLVPVIRDCERKSLADLEKDLAAIAVKAREGKIELEEMAGGTFTISNGGVFGSLFGTPILNPPQSSILGLHSIKDRAVVKDGEIVIRPIMYLALTYDHRIIDGRESVTFLNRIKDKIEDPRKMLLDI